MENKTKADFMEGMAGVFKPLMILLVGLFFVGKSIKNDFTKYYQTYDQIPITAIDSIQLDKFELTGFKIKEMQINGRKSGGIDVYVNDKETDSKVTIIADDINHFLEDYHSKNKIIAKKFEGVHQNNKSQHMVC